MIVEEEVDEEVEEFLEHFGIKGMHWGIRNAANAVGRGTKRASLAVGRGAKRTGQFIREHPKFSASAAVSVTTGAIIAGKILSHNKNKKITELNYRRQSEFLREARMLDTFREVKIRSIMNARKKGNISAEQASRLASLRIRNYITSLDKARKSIRTPM